MQCCTLLRAHHFYPEEYPRVRHCLSNHYETKYDFSTINLRYTRGITAKRVTSDGIHLCGTVPGQHSSTDISRQWQAVGNTVFDLNSPVLIEPETSCTDSAASISPLIGRCQCVHAQANRGSPIAVHFKK